MNFKDTKKWIALAIMLIVVGFGGMAYYQFDFVKRSNADGTVTKHDVSQYNKRWQLTKGGLQNFYLHSEFDVKLQVVHSNSDHYVEVSGEMPQSLIEALESTNIEDHALNLQLKRYDSGWEFLSIGKRNEIQIVIAMDTTDKLKEYKLNTNSNELELMNIAGDNISIEASSGNINADNITANHLEVTTSSGSSSLSHIQAGEIRIETRSGEIEVEVATGNITAQSSSGEIELDQTTGNLNLKTTSGEITSERHIGDGSFQSSSGSINIEKQRADNLEIQTSSGDVTLSRDEGFQGTYETRTSSGDVNVPPSPGATADKIVIQTSSGDIDVQ